LSDAIFKCSIGQNDFVLSNITQKQTNCSIPVSRNDARLPLIDN